MVVLFSADVLVMLDGMLVSVALPSIRRDLDFSAAGIQWVVTAYTLTLGSFLLIGGRASDLFGGRRVLMIGLALFSAGSSACGLAGSAAMLLASKAVAGLRAALAIPSSLALLTAIFRDERERYRVLGLMAGTIDIGMVTGAVLGGVITAALGWPAVFFFVVPFGVAAFALAPAALPEAGERTERPVVFGALADALRSPRARTANLAIVANAGTFGGLVVLSTLYMQEDLGWSALQTGLGFLPLGISAGVGGPLAARLIDRFGPWLVAGVSLAVTAATLLALSILLSEGGYAAALLPAFIVAGFTFATGAVPLVAEAVADAREDEKGVASGLFQTSTHAGGAVVLALLVVISASKTEHGLVAAAALLIAGAALSLRTARASAGVSAPAP